MAEENGNKRIAKNTIFLYFRSLLTMGVTLFSSRVILQALGVEDYGLYGAIGSIALMFSIVNSTLAAGTSRFLTFELGRKDEVRLKKVFSAAFAMHLGMAILLFVLLETIGLWFVNYKLSIPNGRVFAANVVYQLSILTCMFTLTQVPYNATIIAHEKMSIYAYVGISEALFKLALILFLLYMPCADNLIAYAIILAVWSIGLQIFYRFYCIKRFPECHLQICKDKSVYKGMLSYSLWDFIGQFCATGNNQGLNILINMFFGVAINAARTIAFQVEHALLQFSNNFMTAVNPQIIKSYAQKDYKRFFQLIYETGKFAYFLLFFLSLPIFLETKYILSLWLVEVPEYTVLFLRCIMAITLFRIISKPLVTGVHATGNVKVLNLTSGLYSAGTLIPIVYFLYRNDFPVWICFVVQAINGGICAFLETRALYKNIAFNRLEYFFRVYVFSIAVSMVASLLPVTVVFYMQEGAVRLCVTFMVSFTSCFICIFFLVLSKDMRRNVVEKLKKKLLCN